MQKDCSYTLIAIPIGITGINDSGNFVFEFYYNWEDRVQVKLSPGTIPYYTGYGIMHRQI